MFLPRIILLAGNPCSGKNYIAEYMKRYGYKNLAFADEAKIYTSEIENIPLNMFHDRDLKDTEYRNSTPRNILIKHAENAKLCDKNIWVKKIINKIKPNKKYIITDLGFLHEQSLMKEIYGQECTSFWIYRDVDIIEDGRTILPINCDNILLNTGDVSNVFNNYKL
jgi:dephospho-CoA kinase